MNKISALIASIAAFLCSLFHQGSILGNALATKLKTNNKGMGAMTIVGSIVGVVVGIYVFALMFPDAIDTLFNITWNQDVPSGVQTMATTVVAIIGVIVFVMLLIRQAD